MTQDIKDVLKLALEALKQIDEAMPFPVAKLAQKVIKEALAQPEQEPVAKYSDIVSDGGLDPRNTTPPQRSESSGKPSAWVGLTDEEIDYINYTTAHMLAREVEAKLKQKNGYAEEKNT